MNELFTEIRLLIEGKLQELGLLVDSIELNHQGKDRVLTIVLRDLEDKDLDIDRIELASQLISPLLDSVKELSKAYMLEVCSRGPEYPLIIDSDLTADIGKYVELVTDEDTYVGTIIATDETSITLQIRVKTRNKTVVFSKDHIIKLHTRVKI